MTEYIPLPFGYYSESQVRMFLGFLIGDIKELHAVEVPLLAESWEKFKRASAPTSKAEDA